MSPSKRTLRRREFYALNPEAKKRDSLASLKRHKRLYRNSPTFRERQLERSKAYQEKHASDPAFKRLVHVRKRISTERSRIAALITRQGKHEKKLIGLIKERDSLVQSRKRPKP